MPMPETSPNRPDSWRQPDAVALPLALPIVMSAASPIEKNTRIVERSKPNSATLLAPLVPGVQTKTARITNCECRAQLHLEKHRANGHMAIVF